MKGILVIFVSCFSKNSSSHFVCVYRWKKENKENWQWT